MMLMMLVLMMLMLLLLMLSARQRCLLNEIMYMIALAILFAIVASIALVPVRGFVMGTAIMASPTGPVFWKMECEWLKQLEPMLRSSHCLRSFTTRAGSTNIAMTITACVGAIWLGH